MLPEWLTQDFVAIVAGGIALGLWRVYKQIKGQGRDTTDTLVVLLEALAAHGQEMKTWGERFVAFEKSVNARFEAQAKEFADFRSEVVARIGERGSGNGGLKS